MVKRASRKSRATRRLGVELLEDRRVLSVTILSSTAQPTDYDQYLLELINRGRANPTAEASRYGVDLNEGLNPGTISTTPKQPLAFSSALIAAAQGHSQWMLDNNIFSHTGKGGSTTGQRMTAAGYSFVARWALSENIGWRGTTGTFSTIDYVNQIHRNLFLSPSHRVNQMNGNLREFGAGVVAGEFLHNGRNYHSLLVTEKFACSGSSVFLTGVVYDDELVTADQFYTPGEGLGGVTVTAVRDSDGQRFSTQTRASGGYELLLTGGTYTVRASGGVLGGALVENNVSVTSRNVKRDFTRADNAAPVVSNLTATPAAVTQPGALTLMAEGVSDPDGQVVEVRFYRDTNGNVVRDPGDEVLGVDQNASDGWSWSGSTAGWPVGQHTVSAHARDDDGAWSETVSTTVTVNASIHDLTGRQVERHGQVVAGWRNTLKPLDVDGNGAVTHEDALLLINQINYRGAHNLTMRTAERPGPPWFLDPNGDGRLTPADVLTVINQLNSGGASEPEGEADRLFSEWDEGLVSRIPAEMAEERLVATNKLPSGWPKQPIRATNVALDLVRWLRRR